MIGSFQGAGRFNFRSSALYRGSPAALAGSCLSRTAP